MGLVFLTLCLLAPLSHAGFAALQNIAYPKKMIPYFTARPDKTIAWNTMNLCIDASGESEAAVGVSRCNGGANQKWNWVPDSHGRNIIYLEGTKKCLGMKEGESNVFPFELRKCTGDLSEAWEFVEANAISGQGSSENLVLELRHVLISLIALVGVGALSFSAWRMQQKLGARIATPLTVEQAGLALVAPSTTSEAPVGDAQVPSVLVIAASSVKSAKEAFVRKRAEVNMNADELKKQVGYKAVDDYVRSGMAIGLGTGSTAYFAVERIGQQLKNGELKNIVAIPTSKRTQEQADSLGIPLVTLDIFLKATAVRENEIHPILDVSIVGADAVDPLLNLVRGGGGDLVLEKIVAAASKKFVVIIDDSKLCDRLGRSFSVPVEIVPFCHEDTVKRIEALPSLAKRAKAKLRLGSTSNNQVDGDKPAVSDNGNYIVDLHFEKPVKKARDAAVELYETDGVVEHGFFIRMTSVLVVAGKDGVGQVYGTRAVPDKSMDFKKKQKNLYRWKIWEKIAENRDAFLAKMKSAGGSMDQQI